MSSAFEFGLEEEQYRGAVEARLIELGVPLNAVVLKVTGPEIEDIGRDEDS